MNTLSQSLQKNITFLQSILQSEDILSYDFSLSDSTKATLLYADGMVNKEILGDLVSRPLSKLDLQKISQKNKQKQQKGAPMSSTNEENRQNTQETAVQETLLFPELKTQNKVQQIVNEVLDGNVLLLVDGMETGFIVGAKLLPVRAVMEPPTDIAVKGPREGFIEDIKTNMALVRKRLKTPSLRFETMRVGKQSQTAVSLCWLDGISNSSLKNELAKKINNIDIDNVPDSSYVAALIAPRKHSVFRCVGTTEKPDVFTAKIAEGRVGILVDGSPIALTAPFIVSEDFQSSEDYFVSPFMANIVRFLRFFALLVSILLPAFYVCAQLFKMQLLPLGLMLTIASSVRELPLSPSLEMFVVLLLLEILKEASIRMPKYVGMSLSVVGALVLGETAVSAGFLSTPAIIVVALSGICMYTVPNFVETGSVLRWVFLIIAGGIGPLGIVLFASFLLFYLISSDSFGTPLLAPFSPLITHDLRDTVVKYSMEKLTERPSLFRSKNKTRLKLSREKDTQKGE